MTKKVIRVQPIARNAGRNEIIVHANWQSTDKVSPTFEGLMALLLQERIKDGDKASERGATRRGHEA
jgi:hypothetical protein